MASERANRGARLDQPREASRSLFSRPQIDPDTFGRFAEKFARYMGEERARFIGAPTGAGPDKAPRKEPGSI